MVPSVSSSVALQVGDYVLSPIFQPDWFGSNNPTNAKHIVDEGRWAYTPVMTNARGFSNITNPYGILRSPWNTNDVPYLMRSRYILGVKDAGYSLPTCQDFAAYFDTNHTIKLSVILSALNGVLHGPVHIITGGHWGISPTTEKRLHEDHSAGNTSGVDNFLLGSKLLWRQGFVRCPTACDDHDDEAPAGACTCGCPRELWGGMNSSQLLHHTGISRIFPYLQSGWTQAKWNEGGSDEVVEMLCRVGHPGEMFTSAAPQDPLFWRVTRAILPARPTVDVTFAAGSR